MSATTTTATAAQTTMKSTSERSALSVTTTSLREISAAPVYENSNDDQGSSIEERAKRSYSIENSIAVDNLTGKLSLQCIVLGLFSVLLPFLQVNGVDVNDINSLSDVEHVLEYVESAIDDSGSEKSPSVVMETFRECAKLVFRMRNDEE